MLAFETVAHQLYLCFIGLFQEFQDAGVTELFVYTSLRFLQLITVSMCYSLLGCCHLANHSQLRFFWFIEYAILVIEIGYLTRLICMRIHFIFLFHCFIVLLTYSSMLFYCYFLTFGVDRGSPLVPGVRLCFTHIFLVDFLNYNTDRVDLADVLIY